MSNTCPGGGAQVKTRRLSTETPCFRCPNYMRQGANDNICKECEVDYFTGGLSSIATCTTACRPGEHRPFGSEQCSMCPPGTYWQDIDRSTDSITPRCAICPAGTWADGVVPTTGGSCFPSRAGAYAPVNGSTTSLPCAAGSYSTSDGQSSCISCARGGFCPDVGAASAMVYRQCPAGYFNPTEGASSSASCISCPIGTSNPVPGSMDASVCRDCLPGAYAATNGQANCALCEAGAPNIPQSAPHSSFVCIANVQCCLRTCRYDVRCVANSCACFTT